MYRTRAAFLIGSSWRWYSWSSREPNKHEAIIAKARAVGAVGWDFGNADHCEADRANF